MRALAIALALALLVQGSALAQDAWRVDVPAAGYASTETLTPETPFRFYDVTVEAGMVLSYAFSVVGNGTISVRLYFEDFLEYSAAYSSDGNVTEFSRTVPADFGFDRDYHIEVNTTSQEDVVVEAGISTSEAPTENYNLYYALIVIGMVALVAGSWKYVNWQDRKERESKAREKENRRGRGRR